LLSDTGDEGGESGSFEIAPNPFSDAFNPPARPYCSYFINFPFPSTSMMLGALRFHDIWDDFVQKPSMVRIESIVVVIIMAHNIMKEIDDSMRQEEYEGEEKTMIRKN